MENFEDGSLVLCGAKSKRNQKKPCRQPAMANGRCRLHGGKCRGPKTKNGLENSRNANWKHGYYSGKAIEERKQANQMLKMLKNNLQSII